MSIKSIVLDAVSNKLLLRHGGNMNRIFLAALLLFAAPAFADTVQSLSYNPLTGQLQALTKQNGTQVVSTHVAQRVLNQANSAMADAATEDMDSGLTLVIAPGTYKMVMGVRATVTYSVAPTAVNTLLSVTDAANSSVCTGIVATSAGTSTLWRGESSYTCIVTVGASTTYKMRGYIDVLGGTVSDRSVDGGYMIWEKI